MRAATSAVDARRRVDAVEKAVLPDELATESWEPEKPSVVSEARRALAEKGSAAAAKAAAAAK